MNADGARETDAWAEAVRHRLMALRFVQAAMLVGVAIIGGVPLAFAHRQTRFVLVWEGVPVLAAGLALVCLTAGVLLRGRFFRGNRGGTARRVAERYPAFCLMRMGCFESAALLGAVGVMFSRNLLSLCALMLGAVALLFGGPSTGEFLRLMRQAEAEKPWPSRGGG